MKKAMTACLVAAFLVGCSNSSDSGESGKNAELCVEATKQLEENTSDDSDTFMKQIQNALLACSRGCDEGDDGSCESLKAHLDKACSASASICTGLCDDGSEGSLTEYACEAADS